MRCPVTAEIKDSSSLRVAINIVYSVRDWESPVIRLFWEQKNTSSSLVSRIEYTINLSDIKMEHIKTYLRKNLTDKCKVYIGTDSKRLRKNGVWYANYVTAVVIHIEAKYGCKVFILASTEKDYDSKKNRPINRMMMEVYKTSEVYLELKDFLLGKDVEIHLDINPDEKYGSNCAFSQAVGYIKGVCGFPPVVKPLALAASFAADHHL